MSMTNNTDQQNSPIVIEKKLELFIISLNREETRNALDQWMLESLENAIEEAEQDEEVRVIIIQSVGSKSFAAGADIRQLQKRTPIHALLPGMQGLYRKIENSTKATIAIVNGYALGGGCELALACDLRIASSHAKFGLPELNLGIIPGAGGTQRLARAIGKGRALDLILTGKIIDGREAERIGLVNYFVGEEELEDTVETIVQAISKKGPIAIRLAKQAIHKGFDVDLDTALWIEKLSQSIIFSTDDKREGTTAFLEKREPQFKNR